MPGPTRPRQSVAQPENINRDLTRFLSDRTVNPNSRLDDPEEAKRLAQAIELILEPRSLSEAEQIEYADAIAMVFDDEHGVGQDWVARYGRDNLAAWHGQLSLLADPAMFAKRKRWRMDVVRVRHRLMSHLYMVPTRVEDVKGVDPRQRYHALPPHPRVEHAILDLCEVSGDGKQAIALIEQLEEAFPDEFNSGFNRWFDYTNIPVVDGRAPERFARAVEAMATIAGWQDGIAFIRRVDATLERTFRFQKMPLYKRLYARWQKEGEALFTMLAKRRDAEKLLEGAGVLKRADEALLAQLANPADTSMEKLLPFLQDGNAKDFFDLHGDQFIHILGDDFNQRLSHFLELLDAHGEPYIRQIHDALSLTAKPSLSYVPIYRLFVEIERQGGDPKRLLGLIPFERDPGSASIYHLYVQSAKYFGFMLYPRIAPDAYPQQTAKMLIALDAKGLLEGTLDGWRKQVDAYRAPLEGMCIPRGSGDFCDTFGRRFEGLPFALLAALGKERHETKTWPKLVDSDLDAISIPDKAFWVGLAATSQTYDLPEAIENDDQLRREIWDTLYHLEQIFEPSISAGAPRPTEAELARLDAWTERVAGRIPLERPELLRDKPEAHAALKRNLLRHFILGANGRVPSDAELALIEREAIDSNAMQGRKEGAIIALLFLARPPMELLQKAPRVTRALSAQMVQSIVRNNEAQHGVIPARTFLDDERVHQALVAIERSLDTLSEESRERLLNLFFRHLTLEIYIHNEEGPERLVSHLETLRAIIVEKSDALGAFIDILVERHDELRFTSSNAFQMLFDRFCKEGEGKLRKLLGTWDKAGLSISRFYADSVLLGLTEKQAERLRAHGDDPSAVSLLGLTEEQYARWSSFNGELRTKGISLSAAGSVALMDIPDVLPALAHLKERGLLDERFTKSISLSQLLQTWSEAILDRPPMERKRAFDMLDALAERFRDWRFDEYRNPMILPKSQLAIPLDLAALSTFRHDLQDKFFRSHRQGFASGEIVVRAARESRNGRWFFDDDPEHGFSLHDYALYTHALPQQTYASVMGERNKAALVESLMDQLAMLPIRRREKNRLYHFRESVSRETLESLPIAKLIKMQWVLNNLDTPAFVQGIHKQIEADYADESTEYGGYLVQADGQGSGIASLYDPLAIVHAPSGTVDENRKLIRLIDEQIAKAGDPAVKKQLKEQRAALVGGFDGAYVPSSYYLATRFGWQMHWHNHAVKAGSDDPTGAGECDSASYAGPSGGENGGADMGFTVLAGDGLVFTRIDANRFDVDLYGAYHYLDENNRIEWKRYVIDLGVYDVRR